jgi:hypothetical protein
MNSNSRINLEAFQVAFKALDMELELDEIECILASLIYQGHILGYISHQKGFLVLSKENAFPMGK